MITDSYYHFILVVILPPVQLSVDDDGVASTNDNGLATPESRTTTDGFQEGSYIAPSSSPIEQQTPGITEVQPTTTTASMEAGSLPHAITEAEPTTVITEQSSSTLQETQESTTSREAEMTRDSTSVTGEYFNNDLLAPTLNRPLKTCCHSLQR